MTNTSTRGTSQDAENGFSTLREPRMYYAVGHCRGTGCLDNEHVLISAGTAWVLTTADDYNIHRPDAETVFVDSGGFQAVTRWGLEFPWDWPRYFDWCEQLGADYAALPDFACEPKLHSSTPFDRVYHSVINQYDAMQVYERGDYSFRPVPVLQGYDPEDYRLCAEMMKDNDLVRDYMAVGTVCKRESTDEIHNVLTALEDELPGVEYHMFGMTLEAWKDSRLWGRFRSADTAAWTWGVSKADRNDAHADYKERVASIQGKIRGQRTLAMAVN